MSLQNDTLKHFAYNKIFIETGTALGGGVKLAVEAGFEEIYSIEFYEETWRKACEKFRYTAEPKIKIVKGYSPSAIEALLAMIDEPITFFLDAHYMPTEDTPKMLTQRPCPILEEIKAIGQHHRRDHTILIDDWRLFRTNRWKINTTDVLDALMKIGKGDIGIVDGTYKNDIFVVRYR